MLSIFSGSFFGSIHDLTMNYRVACYFTEEDALPLVTESQDGGIEEAQYEELSASR